MHFKSQKSMNTTEVINILSYVVKFYQLKIRSLEIDCTFSLKKIFLILVIIYLLDIN